MQSRPKRHVHVVKIREDLLFQAKTVISAAMRLLGLLDLPELQKLRQNQKIQECTARVQCYSLTLQRIGKYQQIADALKKSLYLIVWAMRGWLGVQGYALVRCTPRLALKYLLLNEMLILLCTLYIQQCYGYCI